MYQKCEGCGIKKDLLCFNWRNKQKQLRKKHCKECDRKYKKKYYENNRRKVIEDNAKRKIVLKEKYINWKKTLACRVCGENDISCLDLHHKNSHHKESSVSQLMHNSSFLKFKSEVEKCVCLCSNCHRKFHTGNLMVNVNEFAGEIFIET